MMTRSLGVASAQNQWNVSGAHLHKYTLHCSSTVLLHTHTHTHTHTPHTHNTTHTHQQTQPIDTPPSQTLLASRLRVAHRRDILFVRRPNAVRAHFFCKTVICK